MYCKSCGSEIKKGAKFCKQCGAVATLPAGRRETRKSQGKAARKKGLIILVLVLIILAVLAAVFFLLIKPKFLDSPAASVKQDSEKAQQETRVKDDKAGKAGNTFGNLANGGGLVQSGEWIYYSDGQGIYKTADIKKEGNLICKATVPNNLNAMGDWIYYTAGKPGKHYNIIYRAKTNGSKSEILSDKPCTALDVLDGRLYYQTADPESEGYLGELYSMQPDGSQIKTVIEDQCRLFGAADGWLYYMAYEGENGVLYRIKPDGTGREKLVDPFKTCSVLVVADDWLYYARDKGSDSWMLTRQKLSSKKTEDITRVRASQSFWEIGLNVKDGWIYFVDLKDGEGSNGDEVKEEIARVKPDGTGRETVFGGGSGYGIFTTDQNVLFRSSENSADELENWVYNWHVLEK